LKVQELHDRKNEESKNYVLKVTKETNSFIEEKKIEFTYS
jgi:hypothetical protein